MAMLGLNNKSLRTTFHSMSVMILLMKQKLTFVLKLDKIE